MTERKYRSNSYRKVKKVTPGHRNVTHYSRKKPKLGTCPVTGEKLKGVPRERPVKMRNMAKSSKRPQRPFGGVLSSKASREVLKNKARESPLQ